MGTVDKPDVYIQFYDEGISDWVELRQKAKNFTIKDAGLLKIPQATVVMRTPASMPEKAERLRIFVNTVGTNYMPFYGKISEITRNPILGTTKKYIELVAYGLEKRLKNDTITWKYAMEQMAHGDLWTYKSMIEDFIVLPDSGYDTNLTLDASLAPNYSFEADPVETSPPTGWIQGSGMTDVFLDGINGDKCARFLGDGTYHRIRSSNSFAVVEGEVYTGEIWVKLDNGAKFYFGLVYQDATWDYFYNEDSVSDQSWKKVSGTITIPAGKTSAQIWIFNYTGNTGRLLADMCTVNKAIFTNISHSGDFTRQSLQDAFRTIAESIDYDGYVYISGDYAYVKFVGLGTIPASPATTFQDPFLRKPQLEESIDEVKNYILPWGGVELGYPSVPDIFTERAQAKYAPDLWEPLDGETIVDSPSDPADLKTTNTATSATPNTLVDTSKSWTTNKWRGYFVYIVRETGARQIREITSNTTTQLTITPNWTTTPDNTSKYQILTGYNPESIEEISHQQLSRYAVDISKSAKEYLFRFRVDRTGVASIDLQKRYTSINFYLFVYKLSASDIFIQIRLTDVNNDQIAKGTTYAAGANWRIRGQITPNWNLFSFPTLPLGEEIRPRDHPSDWYYFAGSTTFDPTQVKYLDIKAVTLGTNISNIFVDRLFFGGGLIIHPFQNPQYYPNYPSTRSPASKDQTSIDSGIGVRLYHHHNRDITSFAVAQDEADGILAVLKQPVKVVTVTKKGFEWLRTNQTVTLNSGSLGISSEIWRTLDLMWEWQANYPVYCTASLIERYAKTIPVLSPHGEVPSRPIWIGKGGGRAAHRGGGARGGGRAGRRG